MSITSQSYSLNRVHVCHMITEGKQVSLKEVSWSSPLAAVSFCSSLFDINWHCITDTYLNCFFISCFASDIGVIIDCGYNWVKWEWSTHWVKEKMNKNEIHFFFIEKLLKMPVNDSLSDFNARVVWFWWYKCMLIWVY